MKDTKVILSTLWIFVMFNYIYADIISLFDSETIEMVLSGSMGDIDITPGFLFGAAILMEIPIVMVILSRVLKYKVNRWANIIAASIKTIITVMTMFLGALSLYYTFFNVVEIISTCLIIWIAWKWTKPKESIVSI